MSAPLDPSPLTEREKLVVWLRHKEGQTLKAIGERIGVTPERVRQILYMVRRKRYPEYGAPSDSLGAFPRDIRWDLGKLGFQTLEEVQASLRLGHLRWSAEQSRVLWNGRHVGWPGWATWEAIHERMGLPCPGVPPEEEAPGRRIRRG